MGSDKDVYQSLCMENTLPRDWHCLIKFLLRALNYEKDFQTMLLGFIVREIISDKMPAAHMRTTSQMSSSSSTLSDKFNVTESALDFFGVDKQPGDKLDGADPGVGPRTRSDILPSKALTHPPSTVKVVHPNFSTERTKYTVQLQFYFLITMMAQNRL